MSRNGNSKENAANLSSKVTSFMWEEPRCQMGGRGWREVRCPGASHWGMTPHPTMGHSHCPAQCHHQSCSSSLRSCVMSVWRVLQSCCRLFFRTRYASKAGLGGRLSQREGGTWVPTLSYALEILFLKTSGALGGLL